MAEFIGMISTREQSEIVPPQGPVIDPAYTAKFARAHEDSGFDRILIGYGSVWPDGFTVANFALQATDHLGVLLAHRPGFVAPTLQARKLATLDQYASAGRPDGQGRLAVHIITGGSDEEQRRDGDFLSKADRYRRTDEYLTVLKLELTSEEPFDFDGEFYQVRGAHSTVRTVTRPHLPIYFGGSSDEAIAVAAKHADVYALWGEPLAEAAQHIDRVKQAAAAYGRTPGISVSFRPILARTDEEAWEKAYRMLDHVRDGSADWIKRTRPVGGDGEIRPENTGSIRLLEAAEKGDRHDRALFTALAKATGAAGNSTALVGSPETVAQALLDYHDIGVTTFLIRGYQPYDDAVDYGRDLIPLVRQELALRERVPAAATA